MKFIKSHDKHFKSFMNHEGSDSYYQYVCYFFNQIFSWETFSSHPLKKRYERMPTYWKPSLAFFYVRCSPRTTLWAWDLWANYGFHIHGTNKPNGGRTVEEVSLQYARELWKGMKELGTRWNGRWGRFHRLGVCQIVLISLMFWRVMFRY